MEYLCLDDLTVVRYVSAKRRTVLLNGCIGVGLVLGECVFNVAKDSKRELSM